MVNEVNEEVGKNGEEDKDEKLSHGNDSNYSLIDFTSNGIYTP
jgi:hypothetical protein